MTGIYIRKEIVTFVYRRLIPPGGEEIGFTTPSSKSHFNYWLPVILRPTANPGRATCNWAIRNQVSFCSSSPSLGISKSIKEFIPFLILLACRRQARLWISGCRKTSCAAWLFLGHLRVNWKGLHLRYFRSVGYKNRHQVMPPRRMRRPNTSEIQKIRAAIVAQADFFYLIKIKTITTL
jgi:hypothetical protein